MARKDRTGSRKTREQRMCRYVPEMGYYLVITDTEATERFFFTGLHDSLPPNMQKKLVIKVVETKTQNMIQKCMELTAYDAQYRLPWIVFDRDQVVNFDEIIREAEHAGIRVGWSNPCFEIWLYAYFGEIPEFEESTDCCARFGRTYQTKTGRKYSKSDEKLYTIMCDKGNEDNAIKLTERKYNAFRTLMITTPSKMTSCSSVFLLVQEIQEKVNQ